MCRGIGQGCPIVPLSFLLVMQVMATHIKKKRRIYSILLFGKHVKVSQLADDTTLFLKDEEPYKFK